LNSGFFDFGAKNSAGHCGATLVPSWQRFTLVAIGGSGQISTEADAAAAVGRDLGVCTAAGGGAVAVLLLGQRSPSGTAERGGDLNAGMYTGLL